MKLFKTKENQSFHDQARSFVSQEKKEKEVSKNTSLVIYDQFLINRLHIFGITLSNCIFLK